jgi:hypothetical protein
VTDYLVRFSLTVPAGSPGDAVDSVIDLFTEKGLRDWVYRVDDPTAAPNTDSLIGFFDGYGEPVDMEALLAAGDATPAIPDVADDADAEVSDTELIDLAESLNQSNEETERPEDHSHAVMSDDGGPE